jgi:glyoxylate/hydroxypyruvate reductase
MAKAKIVVTRQLIDEAQRILDAKSEELDLVQWKSDKVCTSPT